jgi:hypothetical protein
MKDLFLLFVVSLAASACAVAVTTGGVIDGPVAAWTSPHLLGDGAQTLGHDGLSNGLERCAGFSFFR